MSQDNQFLTITLRFVFSNVSAPCVTLYNYTLAQVTEILIVVVALILESVWNELYINKKKMFMRFRKNIIARRASEYLTEHIHRHYGVLSRLLSPDSIVSC